MKRKYQTRIVEGRFYYLQFDALWPLSKRSKEDRIQFDIHTCLRVLAFQFSFSWTWTWFIFQVYTYIQWNIFNDNIQWSLYFESDAQIQWRWKRFTVAKNTQEKKYVVKSSLRISWSVYSLIKKITLYIIFENHLKELFAKVMIWPFWFILVTGNAAVLCLSSYLCLHFKSSLKSQDSYDFKSCLHYNFAVQIFLSCWAIGVWCRIATFICVIHFVSQNIEWNKMRYKEFDKLERRPVYNPPKTGFGQANPV